MKTILTLALGGALLCGGLSAQTYDELPAGYPQKVDTIYDYFICPSSNYVPLHLQYAYDVNDIPVAAANYTEIAWHRNNYYSNAMPAGSITCTVTMSHSPNTPANMSTTFASNLGTLTKVVFTGTASFPAISKGTGPAPWTHVIKLSAPFQFIKPSGASLVVDVVTTAVSGYVNSTYTIDASAPDGGVRTSNPSAQSSCKFSNGNYNNSIGYTTGGLTNNGGTWYVRYSNVLPNAPGLATLSLHGMDNKGIWPLPIDLGLLGAPGCAWHVGLELGLWVPITANASGQAAWPNITIPPGLGGGAFYDHAFLLDPQANAAGIVVTWSSKWYIGTGIGPSANTVYKIQDSASSPTGTLRSGYGTHLRLTR